MRNLHRGGRLCRRLRQDSQEQDVPGDPSHQRKDPQRRKSIHGQGSCQCGDQDHDQRIRMWIFWISEEHLSFVLFNLY